MRNSGPPKSFRNLLTFRLHRLARLSERLSEDYYREHAGLSLPECRVIGVTARFGSLSFTTVANEAGLEKSHASRIISNLVTKGILEKLVNPSDGRSVMLGLTERGMAIHGELHQAALQLDERLTSALTPDQAEDFSAILTLLTERLERAAAPGGAQPEPAGSQVPRDPPAESLSDPAPSLDRVFAQQLHALLSRYLAE